MNRDRSPSTTSVTHSARVVHHSSSSSSSSSCSSSSPPLLQSLDHLRHMYDRLDAHNDDLEGAFAFLRDRHCVWRKEGERMRHAARALRAAQKTLRNDTICLLNTHAEDMRQVTVLLQERLSDGVAARRVQQLREAHVAREATLQQRIRILQHRLCQAEAMHPYRTPNGTPPRPNHVNAGGKEEELGELERRVRTALLADVIPPNRHPIRPEEEKRCRAIAKQLLSSAPNEQTVRRMNERNGRQTRGMDGERRRSPLADVATVARGVWAEELLRQRGVRRRSTSA